ncbi:YHS domain-containing (seleno)protein [Aliivibrio sifiae]|uniref:YHS domain protein n=1 Tax=Aliivibrio sifiae TaxID=566293 RepID=A0A2S7X0W4_9GAMM|nr:YHS domain-containing (seleno)protein [Aliivibrio sifiae]PQJ83480.1 YHS domain protein [Aliivibrio sifiae]
MKKLFCLFILLFSHATFASDAVYTGFFSNKAIDGYDSVSYFTADKPLKGHSEFVTSYMDADWYFSSQENLDLFSANPTKYAPQYGGFCAWAVAEKNDRAPGDPNQFSIVAGKLYLNYDAQVKGLWEEDIQGFITQGDKNWPKLLKNKR